MAVEMLYSVTHISSKTLKFSYFVNDISGQELHYAELAFESVLWPKKNMFFNLKEAMIMTQVMDHHGAQNIKIVEDVLW